ncbi:MAG: histidine kinase [Betaproteobacteria bacterium]|nr:histidine kinase [Betaproteobacteria bacterium]
MPLPPKVQVAVDVLTPYGVDVKSIAPPLYRWYVRHEPATPPPLWDASTGYWTAHAVYVALIVGSLITAFAVWFMGFGTDPATLKTAQRVFLVSQFAGWAVAGLIGWTSAYEMRCQMRFARKELGLPGWEHMHAGWQPSFERLRERAVPERYWLKSLHSNPLFGRSQFAGVLAFALASWFLAAHMAKAASLLAIVYLLVCAFAIQRTARGKALPRGARLWAVGHGLASGALLAALIWNGVVAAVLKLPSEPALFAFVLVCIALHAWEHLVYEQDRSRALRAETAEQARQLAEARLHALTAQIEPHFIFNTLAHLKSMIANDPVAAQGMADELSDFLRASLKALRSDTGTVGDELALVRAYLGIARLRLGERLTTDVRSAPEVNSLSLPSHLLLTLVENAVQHGIEPKAAPARIEVSASREERDGRARLVLRVSDDGAGFGTSAAAGSGTGLANVRERMASAYGADATLRLTQNAPSGVIAELDLPLPPTPPTAA